MSARKLPDPNQWQFVLVHRVARHGASIVIQGYDEVARSFLSLHAGELKPTIVVKKRTLYDRILRLGGWLDITGEVGPHTPKLWDDERDRWRLDPEGLLPWERRPGERGAPLPVAEADQDEEEVELLPPPKAPKVPGETGAPTERPKAQPKASAQPKAEPKSSGNKPSTRPLGG